MEELWSNANTISENNRFRVKKEEFPHAPLKKRAVIQKIFIIGIILFLILLIKMAPGTGEMKFLFYVIIAIPFIFLSIALYKIGFRKATDTWLNIMVAFVILLNVGTVSACILYEMKYQHAVEDIPDTGTVTLKISVDDEYYSITKTGYVTNPSAHVKLGDEWYENGDTLTVTLQESYFLRTGCSYSYNGQIEGSYNDDSITFSSANLENSYRIRRKFRQRPQNMYCYGKLHTDCRLLGSSFI
jgi:hypothetical protein